MKNGLLVRRSLTVTGILAASLAMILAVLWMLLAVPATTHADSPDHADVVVQFDDENAIARGIQFTAPISGLEALYLTGLDVITKDMGWGIAVCSIESVGCPASDCFCGGSNYWGYNYWDGNAWQGYLVGAADSSVGNGAVEGWRWGAWGSTMVPAPQMTAAVRALDWLHTQQQTDGGYGSIGTTVETLLSIGANGYTAAEWRDPISNTSIATYLAANGASFVTTPAAAGKMAVAVVGTHAPYPTGALTPMGFFSPTIGAFDAESAANNAWAILGTVALGQQPPASAVGYLKGMQQSSGGWEWSAGWGTDTNSTALALQALVAAGEPLTATEIISGLAFLQTAQNTDGGFTYDPVSPWGTDSDTNSTAYVLQALQATNQPAPVVGTGNFGSFVISGTTPISYLLSIQLSNGAFEWQPGFGENALATQQAVPALLGQAFPLAVLENKIFLPLILR